MCIEFKSNNFIYESVFYLFVYSMKKKSLIILCVIIVLILCFFLLRNSSNRSAVVNNLQEVVMEESSGEDLSQQLLESEVSPYKVNTKDRWDMLWEDIFVYDSNNDLVFSLDDKNQPQYLFTLYKDYLILDSWTSASQREILVYDIKSKNRIFRTDYYPWELGLVLNDNVVEFYKKIDDSQLWDYTLPQCEDEYSNGYVEKYGYTIWDNLDSDLGDIQCAYFE